MKQNSKLFKSIGLLLVVGLLFGALPAGSVKAQTPVGHEFVLYGAGTAAISSEEFYSSDFSVKFTTVGINDAGMLRFTFADGFTLDELTALSYWEFVDTRDSNLDIFVDIWLDFDNDGVATSADYPAYMQAEPIFASGAAATLDTWTYIDAMNLRWSTYVGPDDPWSAPTIAELQANTVPTWTNNVDFGQLDILRIDIRVGSGGPWTNFTGYADDITINSYVAFSPVAEGQPVTTAEDTAVYITLAATDLEGDPLTYSIVRPPTNGTAVLGRGNVVLYTPALNYNGPDNFTFEANDGSGGIDVARVTITVTAVNDAPVASNQSVSTAEETAVDITLVATDVDSVQLTYSIVAGPTNGTAILVDNEVTYTPAPNYFGSDSFTFIANDTMVDSNVATVTISVTPVKDSPLAVDDAYETAHDKTLTINAAMGVLANDTDPDGDAKTATLVTNVLHGTLSLYSDGSFTYTPAPGFVGTDNFVYRLVTYPSTVLAAEWTDDALVTITVTPYMYYFPLIVK